MPATYRIGDNVPLTYYVRDANGNLVNATVTLTITAPDGSTSAPGTSNTATGTYAAIFSPTMSGLWRYAFTAVGTVTDAEDGLIQVEPAITGTWYVTVPELRMALGDPVTRPAADQGLLEQACRAASQAVDRYTNRRFWRDPTTRIRTFRPTDPCEVWLRADISGTTGLVVETSDGTTWTPWTATDYELGPSSADQGGQPYAFWQLVAVGARRFPIPTMATPVPSPLRITARWGWSEVPPDVRMAAQIIAQRLYRRKDTPFGTEGFADFGAMRIVKSDPDILALLTPLQRLAMA